MGEVIFITVIIVMLMMVIVTNIFTNIGEVVFIAGVIAMFMLALLAAILIQVTVFKSRPRIGNMVKKRIFKRSGKK